MHTHVDRYLIEVTRARSWLHHGELQLCCYPQAISNDKLQLQAYRHTVELMMKGEKALWAAHDAGTKCDRPADRPGAMSRGSQGRGSGWLQALQPPLTLH